MQYGHIGFTEQLNLGLRNLEIDVVYDPGGGRYKNPLGLKWIKDAGAVPQDFDPNNDLSKPGLKVFHIPDKDFRSHHLLFTDCLRELKTWSAAHPGHLPVIITMNLKDSDTKGRITMLPFTGAAMDSIDAEIRSVFAERELITPDLIRGKYPSLNEAVLKKGWPLVSQVKGRFLFVLDEKDEKIQTYKAGHPSLKNRVLFVNEKEGSPEAAFMIMNNAIKEGAEIQRLVKKGYMIRTRADADTKEARANNYTMFEAAKRSGAQVITTDYYLPSTYFKSDYKAVFDDGKYVRAANMETGKTLSGQTHVKNVIDFGAKPDTNVMNTIAIQKTINAVAAAGGGIVIIPSGEFRTGNLELKSGVNLHLEPGAVLAGSDKRKDYDTYEKASLIFAKGQKNISITGSGTIDGRGRQLMNDIFKRLEEGTLTDPAWRLTRPGEGTRTNLIYFEECENIVVKNATLKDASSWVTHYERCRNVIIDSIRLESVAYWNNDGIDIVDCRNMRITNSYIDAADDAICLKSARRGDFCDSIYIANCTFRSSANALKFGTGSIGGFKNVTVRNLTIFNTFRSAIALEAVDGGFLENVDIRDVVATNTGNALIIRLGHRNKDDVYSTVKNIYIGNMKVTVPKGKPDAGYETEGPILMYPPGYTPTPGKIESISPWNYKERSPNVKVYEHNVFPSSISGLPGHPVENVRLENIDSNLRDRCQQRRKLFSA